MLIKLNKYVLPYISLIVLLTYDINVLISFTSIILHELMHFLVAKSCLECDGKIDIGVFGARLNLYNDKYVGSLENIMVAVSGPLFNIILGIILFFYGYDSIANVNLIIGLFNLIPSLPLDGERILKAILSRRMLFREATSIIIKISYTFVLFLFIIFIYSVYCKQINVSILIMAVMVLICSIREGRQISYIVMGDIVDKKNRFKGKGYLQGSIITVDYSSSLLKALSLVDKGKYTLFYILDENMSIITTLGENEILDGLKLYGDLKIIDFLEKRNII